MAGVQLEKWTSTNAAGDRQKEAQRGWGQPLEDDSLPKLCPRDIFHAFSQLFRPSECFPNPSPQCFSIGCLCLLCSMAGTPAAVKNKRSKHHDVSAAEHFPGRQAGGWHCSDLSCLQLLIMATIQKKTDNGSLRTDTNWPPVMPDSGALP